MHMMAEKIENKAKSPSVKRRKPKASHVPRRFSPLIILFAVFVIAMFLLIVYIAFSKTTITVDLKERVESVEFQYQPSDLDADERTITLEEEFTFSDFSEFQDVEGVATGTVTIINDYVADQQLVETTRLLSEDGVLFRLAESIVVPSGGSIDVEVYADESGLTGDIGPTTFEIVNLQPVKKSVIYAMSEDSMTGGVGKEAILRDEDIKSAKKKAKQDLRKEAIRQLQDELRLEESLSSDQVKVEIIGQTVDQEVGNTVTNLTVRTEAKVIVYYFNEGKLEDVLERDTEFSKVSLNDVTYAIETIGDHVLVVGVLEMPSTGADVMDTVDMSQLTGKSREDMIAYLESFQSVEAVDIKFSPFWIVTSPPIVDRIELVIK